MGRGGCVAAPSPALHLSLQPDPRSLPPCSLSSTSTHCTSGSYYFSGALSLGLPPSPFSSPLGRGWRLSPAPGLFSPPSPPPSPATFSCTLGTFSSGLGHHLSRTYSSSFPPHPSSPRARPPPQPPGKAPSEPLTFSPQGSCLIPSAPPQLRPSHQCFPAGFPSTPSVTLYESVPEAQGAHRLSGPSLFPLGLI